MVEDEYDGFILRKDNISSNSFESKICGLGKLRWAKSIGHNIDLCGKRVLIRRLRKYGEFWKEMTSRDEDFQENVPEWLQEKHWGRKKYQVCLVVRLLMCQDVDVTASDEEAKDRIARGEVPLRTVTGYVAAAHGVPGPTSVAGNISSQVSETAFNGTYFQARGQGTRIFALELKMISSKKRKLELTDKTLDSDRKLGPDEEDDLVLEDMSAKDWNELVQDEELETR